MSNAQEGRDAPSIFNDTVPTRVTHPAPSPPGESFCRLHHDSHVPAWTNKQMPRDVTCTKHRKLILIRPSAVVPPIKHLPWHLTCATSRIPLPHPGHTPRPRWTSAERPAHQWVSLLLEKGGVRDDQAGVSKKESCRVTRWIPTPSAPHATPTLVTAASISNT
jgi:hypothetical protein